MTWFIWIGENTSRAASWGVRGGDFPYSFLGRFHKGRGSISSVKHTSAGDHLGFVEVLSLSHPLDFSFPHQPSPASPDYSTFWVPGEEGPSGLYTAESMRIKHQGLVNHSTSQTVTDVRNSYQLNKPNGCRNRFSILTRLLTASYLLDHQTELNKLHTLIKYD